MATIPEAFNLALQHHQAGRLHEAEALYRQILQAQPDHPDAFHLLGLIAHHAGRHADAIELIGKAIAINPTVAVFHNHLGEAYRVSGRIEEALVSYQRALGLHAEFVEAHYNLGVLHSDQGRREEAIACYRRVLSLKPDYVWALNNLGNAFAQQGEVKEAEAHYRRAMMLKPDFAEAYNNLGALFQEQGRFEEAVAHHLRALSLKAMYPEAFANAGNALKQQGKLSEAETCYRKALSLRPDDAFTHVNLGDVLQELGKVEEAVACYRQAQELLPNDGIKIRLATILPVIMGSTHDVRVARKKLDENVSALLKEKLVLTEPVQEAGKTNFFLAYHGQNDRKLQIKLAQMFARACPSLLFTSTHCLPGSIRQDDSHRKIRVGFVSRYFFKHPVGVSFNRLIEFLSTSGRLEVLLLTVGNIRDDYLMKAVANCNACVQVPADLPAARETIAGLALDVLVYPEIGMDPFTYFLAFARLAPVQCVMGGHPVTTGISNMDYFLSGELLETASAQGHYSEKLVKFKSLPAVIPKPELPSKPMSRPDLGLSVDRKLYVCPARLQKLHPDFDSVLAEILRQDRNGEIILFMDQAGNTWHELVMGRLARSMPDVVERVRFLPWAQTKELFMSILMQADVVLDPFHFGLGTTAFMVLAAGYPIVTWPSKFLRGRVTVGLYKRIGVLDCVADDPQRYIEIAVRLGTDQGWREAIKEKILAKNSVLFEDMKIVGEFERFCVHAIEVARGAPGKCSPRGTPRK